MEITKRKKTVEKVLRDIIAMTERICADDGDISDITLDGIDRIKRMTKEALETNQITNLEWLQNANASELARFLWDFACPPKDKFGRMCPVGRDYGWCIGCWKRWLGEKTDRELEVDEADDKGETNKKARKRIKNDDERGTDQVDE